MSPRLLSLLTLIETALIEQGLATKCTRTVNYRKGMARMTFSDGSGSIVVQNFQLADGQICLRVDLTRKGAGAAEETAIYPQTLSFDWGGAADRIAQLWCAMAGREAEAAIASEA